jgi:hypothetical protein
LVFDLSIAFACLRLAPAARINLLREKGKLEVARLLADAIVQSPRPLCPVVQIGKTSGQEGYGEVDPERGCVVRRRMAQAATGMMAITQSVTGAISASRRRTTPAGK